MIKSFFCQAQVSRSHTGLVWLAFCLYFPVDSVFQSALLSLHMSFDDSVEVS